MSIIVIIYFRILERDSVKKSVRTKPPKAYMIIFVQVAPLETVAPTTELHHAACTVAIF